MGKFNLFVFRAILSGVFAVVLSRIFHPEFHPLWVVGLAVMLLGLAYFMEYLGRRKSRSGPDDGQ